jgi:RNA polymerase I-specific transcription initiation factor RRN6
VVDIDGASSIISGLLEVIGNTSSGPTQEGDERVDLQGLTTASFLFPEIIQELHGSAVDPRGAELVAMYEAFLHHWISHLAPHISGRSRVEIERSVRAAAMQVYLGSHGIRSFPGSRPLSETRGTAGSKAGESFPPIRQRGPATIPSTQDIHEAPSASNDHDMEKSSQPADWALPTPEATAEAQSRHSGLLESKPTYSPSISLKQFTSLGPQPPLSRSMNSVLSHWTLGEDPRSYDWEATRQVTDLQGETDEAEGEPADGRRQRAKRQREWRRIQAQMSAPQPGPSTLPSSQLELPRISQPHAGSSQTKDFESSQQAIQSSLGKSLPLRKSAPKKGRPGFR